MNRDSDPEASHSSRTLESGHPLQRRESDLNETGLVWDERRREWVSEDEAAEHQSQETQVAPPESPVKGDAGEKHGDVIWVDWDGPHDPENPYHFSKARKWTTASISCLFTLVVAWTGTSFPVGNASLIAELGCSRELAVLGLSAYPLGFGLAPLFLAPISEETGRYLMYCISCAIYVIFLVPTAVGKNIATIIVSRFICGLATSTGSTLVGGTIADLFESHDRGPAMSLFSVSAFAGTGLGPALMAYPGERLGFRWIQYIQIMIGGVMLVAIIFLTQETRGSVILARRAKRLRKETGNPAYQTRHAVNGKSMATMIKASLTRPLYLLATEAIVASFSLWVGVSWGVLFLSLESVSLVMEQVYGFSSGQAGLTYLSVLVAAGLGYWTNLYQERLYQKNVGKKGPEARLYAACVGGLLFPAGLFIFAFSQGRGHWMGPVVGLVVLFLGIFTIYNAVFNYLADCYTRATFLAGCIALLLSATPFVLFYFGPQIRARSRFARKLEEIKAS